MKKTLKIIFCATAIVSCSTNTKFSATGSNEEIIQQAVSVLKKHPDNEEAKKQLKISYEEIVKLHEDRIREIKLRADSNYLEEILPEFNALQDLHSTISPIESVVKNVLHPVSYADEIKNIKQKIAGESYERATGYLNKDGWENAKISYKLLLKADRYIADYKGSKKLLKEVFDKNIVNVVINPETVVPKDENSKFKLYFDSRDIQKRLVKDLGGDSYKFDNRIPAKFYSDADAKKRNIQADWVINIRMKDLGFSTSNGLSFRDEHTKEINPGGDIKPDSYASQQTASGQLNITQRENSMSATIEYRIFDIKADKVIGEGELPASYGWQNQYAKYSGDYRALDRQDWELINESKRNDGSSLRTEKLVGELFENAYPSLRQVVLYFVKW